MFKYDEFLKIECRPLLAFAKLPSMAVVPTYSPTSNMNVSWIPTILPSLLENTVSFANLNLIEGKYLIVVLITISLMIK